MWVVCGAYKWGEGSVADTRSEWRILKVWLIWAGQLVSLLGSCRHSIRMEDTESSRIRSDVALASLALQTLDPNGGY